MFCERNLNLGTFISNFANVIRLPKPELIEYDLSTLIKKVIFLGQAINSDKEITISASGIEDKFILNIDPIQFEQVLMNILKNAIESIPQSVKIQILLSKWERKLVIRDDGPGITEKNSRKLFTPFFSTKPRGQGIGLTLVREILFNHSFKFSLTTAPLLGLPKYPGY
jgi:nitrogen fixation/metabolism regulation signal transduction histidine kinase